MSRPITSVNHGEYGYAKRTHCDCQPCTMIRRRYDKQARIRKARGQSRRWDCAESRAHVQALVDGSANYYQIARATGGLVKETQVRRLICGNQYGQEVTWLFSHTVQALLAVTLEQALAEESLRPAIGVHRRIQALTYMGYSMIDIANQLDVSDRTVWNYTHRTRLLTSTIARFDDMYVDRCMIPGTSERARWRAYRAGHAPPMAWDDDIDDPNAAPDWGSVVCIVEHCFGVVDGFNLCNKHFRRVSEADGFYDAEKFRAKVIALGKQPNINAADTMAQLTDLKGMGLTPAQAAERINRSAWYVTELWESA